MNEHSFLRFLNHTCLFFDRFDKVLLLNDPRIFQILFGDLFCLNSIITWKYLKIIEIFKKIQYQQTKLHC